MPKRRQWVKGGIIAKAVNPNMMAMAASQAGQSVNEPRAFPLLEAINTATGQIMANGGTQGADILQGFRALPRDPRDDSAFGPMDPLRPEAIDQLDSEGHTAPRSWQYQVGWNLPGSGQRETPWQVLRAASVGVGIIRRCIEARKKDVSDLAFVFAPTEEAINDAYQLNPGAGRLDAEQKLREELLPEMIRLREFWARPWKARSLDFKQWCRMVLEHVLVDDAVPIYPSKTYGGDVYDLEVIDPSTIKPLLDSRGNRPAKPHPAFQQILYGFPRGEWAATTELDDAGNVVIPNGFGSAEMMYYVANPRTFSPYGYSPVEMALFDSRLYLQRQKWMIAEYDDGSTPLTWIETAAPADGKEMTLTQQRLWERAFNAKVSGNTRERARAKVLPNGWKAMQMTSVDERYRPEYDLYLIKLLASYFGVTATRLGFGETNGLGGSGFSESQMAVTGELGLKPDTEVLTAIINEASCQFLGMDKRIGGTFVDPAQANSKEQIDGAVAQQGAGQISVNEVRQKLGQSLLPFEEANMPFVLGGPQGIIFLEGAKATIEQAMQAQQMAAETSALGTAGKLSMEERKLSDGKEARQEEHDFQRETREAETEVEKSVNKAAELRAFRVWRSKRANAGDQPRRPFLFKCVAPDDADWLAELSPFVVSFEGWEWVSDEDITKAAKAKGKSPFDYIEWNARNPLHPKGPNGRWVKRGSDLHTALIEEGKRHAEANAPKPAETGAVSDASSTLQGMRTESAAPVADHEAEWKAWADNPRPIQAYTIPKSETGTGREKHAVILPDRNANVIKDGKRVLLLDVETDEVLFDAGSMPNLWRNVSAYYGAQVEHEHEGSGKRTLYGASGHDPKTAPAAEEYARLRQRPVPDAEAKAVARQARIDAAKAKAGFLAELEEAIINESTSAELRRMTDVSARRHGLDSDPVAGHVMMNMDSSSINTAAAAWGLRRFGDEGAFDPALHTPVGDRLRPGQPSELVKPGYIFRDGDEEVQLMRAVVDGRISEPESKSNGATFWPSRSTGPEPFERGQRVVHRRGQAVYRGLDEDDPTGQTSWVDFLDGDAAGDGLMVSTAHLSPSPDHHVLEGDMQVMATTESAAAVIKHLDVAQIMEMSQALGRGRITADMSSEQARIAMARAARGRAPRESLIDDAIQAVEDDFLSWLASKGGMVRQDVNPRMVDRLVNRGLVTSRDARQGSLRGEPHERRYSEFRRRVELTEAGRAHVAAADSKPGIIPGRPASRMRIILHKPRVEEAYDASSPTMKVRREISPKDLKPGMVYTPDFNAEGVSSPIWKIDRMERKYRQDGMIVHQLNPNSRDGSMPRWVPIDSSSKHYEIEVEYDKKTGRYKPKAPDFPEAPPVAAPVALIKPGRGSAGFVTSATNAHSLKRGDMVVVHNQAAHVIGHRREGNVIITDLDDGRTVRTSVNEPFRRVTGGAAGGGGISKAADVGPGGVDPKAQGSTEPTMTPTTQPDTAWPGWLMDMLIASIVAQALVTAMTSPGLGISALVRSFLDWARGYQQGDPVPDVKAWLREVAPGDPLGAIVDAITPAIRQAHIEGAFVGQQSAAAALEYVEAGGSLGDDRDPALQLSVNWGDWVPGHPEAAQALLDPNGLERLLYQSNAVIKGIAANRLDEVGRILGEGLARGDSPAKIGRALRELGDPAWAHMTALTETNRAQSYAAVMEYRKAGLKYKGWMTAFDQRVCKICDHNAHHEDGRARIVPIDELFPSGDPWPPGHPRCRCAPIPILNLNFAKAVSWVQWNTEHPAHPKGPDGQWVIPGFRVMSEHDYADAFGSGEHESPLNGGLTVRLTDDGTAHFVKDLDEDLYQPLTGKLDENALKDLASALKREPDFGASRELPASDLGRAVELPGDLSVWPLPTGGVHLTRTSDSAPIVSLDKAQRFELHDIIDYMATHALADLRARRFDEEHGYENDDEWE